MPDAAHALAASLAPLLTGRVCVVGVGNRLAGDDAAGPAVIDALRGSAAADCLDAGDAPENFLGKILALAPDTLLIVDAVCMGGAPGEVRVLDPDRLDGAGISTHALSLDVACRYLRARREMRIRIVGIQPAAADPGAPLSEAARAAVRLVADALRAVPPRS